MGKSVIVECDFSSKEELESFLDQMEEVEPNLYCKLGMELFCIADPDSLETLEFIKSRNHKLLLELELKGTPSSTVKKLVEAGPDMIHIHADDGLRIMQETAKEIKDIYSKYEEEYIKLAASTDRSLIPRMMKIKKLIDKKPILLGDTVLTNFSNEDLKELGDNKDAKDQVAKLARLCKNAGFDGVVCSPDDIMIVKEVCGPDFITVASGIRYVDSKKDDPKIIATPACANIMGCDYIVVDREVREAKNPKDAYIKYKKDFTEETSTLKLSKEEMDYTRAFIEEIRAKVVLPSNIVAQKLLDAKSFIINTEDPFLLKSGVAAPIYMNNRDLYKYPEEQKVVMDYLAELVRTYYPNAEAIFGTPMSAISFGALVAERLGLKFGFVRKEVKDHGLKTSIEGPVEKGLKVVQIEDLITSGESSLEFIRPLQNAKMDVLGIAAIVDNDFVESKKLIDAGIEYHTITTGTKIAEYAASSGIILPKDVKKVLAYKNDPTDESWMSKKAKKRIEAKRLERLNKNN